MGGHGRSRRRGRSGRSTGRSRRREDSGEPRALREEIAALRAEVGRMQDRRDGYQTSRGGRAGKGRRGGGGDREEARGGRGGGGGGGGRKQQDAGSRGGERTATAAPRTSAGTNGPRPAGREEGWFCQACGEHNWQWRKLCRCCRVPPAGYAAATRAAAAATTTPGTGANAVPLGRLAASRAPQVAGGPGAAPAQPAGAPVVGTSQADAAPAAAAAAPGPAAAEASVAGQPPQAAPAPEPSPANGRKTQQAARQAEAELLARLDAALAVLPAASLAAREQLTNERQAAAERLAAARPLGQRLAWARRRAERAKQRLAVAEAAAAEAALTAEKALEEEHAARAALQELEAQVADQKPAVAQDVTTPAAALLAELCSWLHAQGAEPPPSIARAAAQLGAALEQRSPTHEPSPTVPADSDTEDLMRDEEGGQPPEAVGAEAGAGAASLEGLMLELGPGGTILYAAGAQDAAAKRPRTTS